MALTKVVVEAIDDWTAVAQNTVVEGTTYDCSAVYEAILGIQAFLDSTTAHTGTRFLVQVSHKATGDEDWYVLGGAEFVNLIGTANSEAIVDNPLAANSTRIDVASTTGYTNGIWFAIEDATLLNSELCFQKALATNDYIDILDGTTNAHVQNTTMYNIAFTRTILIPIGVYRFRVIIDNTYDNDGSTLNFKTSISKVTGV